ncbi:class I SAM-dependent methyltransferase [Aquimarina sp. AU119]|uniref:class I SAM-dependent methyltransferase n=1 Tax=Aquimarina sp. AU119 TaxID=2108528 RepID=UPI000D68AB54|nr:class I SAM-dependent methyltransferase [Aquimarina sp. AU119]
MNNQYDPEYIKTLFNKMSGSYERVNYITSFGFSLRWRKQFLDPIKPSDQELEVIDLMTGMGETWHPVKRHFPNGNFTALDFSEGMLRQAHKKNSSQFNDSVNVTNQNALQNNLPSDHFDVVLSAFGLKTFSDEQIVKLAEETKRILKAGGEFSFIEVSQPKSLFLRGLYKLHLKYIVPICGRLLIGNPREYKMLWKYTEVYENSLSVAEIFKSEGLDVTFHSYFGGCATGISGRKEVSAE